MKIKAYVLIKKCGCPIGISMINGYHKEDEIKEISIEESEFLAYAKKLKECTHAD